MAEHSPVQSLDRAFDLLEILCRSRGGMTIGALSAETGLHKSTVHRLLTSMCMRGYVQRDAETSMYRAGMRLCEMSSYIVDNLDVVDRRAPCWSASAARRTRPFISSCGTNGMLSISIRSTAETAPSVCFRVSACACRFTARAWARRSLRHGRGRRRARSGKRATFTHGRRIRLPTRKRFSARSTRCASSATRSTTRRTRWASAASRRRYGLPRPGILCDLAVRADRPYGRRAHHAAAWSAAAREPRHRAGTRRQHGTLTRGWPAQGEPAGEVHPVKPEYSPNIDIAARLL